MSLVEWDPQDVQAAASALVAAATVVLVGVTIAYMRATKHMASATRGMARETRRSVEVANAALVLQSAPVVVPRSAGGGGSTARDGQWTVKVQLSNIGSGPAFGVRAEVRIGSHTFGRARPVETLERTAETPSTIKCSLPYGDYEDAGKRWSARVEYTDVLSRSYVLTRSIDGDLDIELEGKPLRLPRSLSEEGEEPTP